MHWLSPSHPLTLGQQITGVPTTGSVGTVKAPRQPPHSSRITINISSFMSNCGPWDEWSGSYLVQGTLITRLSHVWGTPPAPSTLNSAVYRPCLIHSDRCFFSRNDSDAGADATLTHAAHRGRWEAPPMLLRARTESISSRVSAERRTCAGTAAELQLTLGTGPVPFYSGVSVAPEKRAFVLVLIKTYESFSNHRAAIIIPRQRFRRSLLMC